jgi:hypothetical protein
VAGAAVIAVVLLAAGCRGAGVEAHRPSSEATLIPATTFFANRAAVGDYQVSPDGRWLGWVTPVDGRFTVHVRPREGGPWSRWRSRAATD